MKATEKPILEFLRGPKQFYVPIFQRRYSWEQKHCYKLWDDVLRVGENDEIKSHFLGSIVYMEPGVQNIGSVPKYQVIDGQQRLTTLSLLLSALSREIKEEDSDIDITPKKLSNYYLFNDGEDGELRFKQLLTKRDKDTLIYLLESGELLPSNPSPLLVKNYRFFENKLKDVDLKTLYAGLEKLMIVDIVLERTEDNPQLIYESLNSTGVRLSQADLIRNYVLMGQSSDLQKYLYNKYWYPMEQLFGDEYRKRFDRFMRAYLTLKTDHIPNLKNVYEEFKKCYGNFKKYYSPDITANSEKLEVVVSEIQRYAQHYVNIAIPTEEDQELRECLDDFVDMRAEVAYPFLLEVYDYYREGKVEKLDVIKTLRLVESYVFRRAICGLSSKFLNHIFVNALRDLKGGLEEALNTKFFTSLSYSQRFPKDSEFKEALLRKDVYNFPRCEYMLRRLENYENKEPTKVDKLTIEHVMPQSLTEAWQEELGENYSEIHYNFLHTIGNLTLTGYNIKYSNRPFNEKRDIDKGFRDSHLFLNKSLARAEQWNEDTIKARGTELAEKACKVWSYPEGDDDLSIEEKDDYPSAKQKLRVTAKYRTSSDETSMSDWSEWEQELGLIIIEMFEYRDPSGFMIFEPRDIQDYYPRLKKMWPDNNSISETVGKMLASLVNRGELEKPNRGEYRLVEGELLHLHLKQRILERQLAKLNLTEDAQ